MSDYRESGASPKALFPGAWRYYDGIVATCALILMVVNTLIGLDLFTPTVDRRISMGVAVVTAVLLWLRLRATQLGVATNKKHQPPQEPTQDVDPQKGT